jgi:DNA-binding transcriptional ArsR family regulator
MMTKTELFLDEQTRLAELAKALAHPARIAILELIAQRDSCVCGEIVDELPLAQSTVSQHLKELKHAGLIKGEVEGPRVCYCLDQATISRFRAVLGDLFEKLTQKSPPERC